MSAKSQKAFRAVAIVILSIAAAAFIIMYFIGRVDAFLGITGGTSESSAARSVQDVNEVSSELTETESIPVI